MLDLETASTRPDAAILTIGAVKFNRGEEASNNTFYRRVTIESCNELELHTDSSTLDWWANQSKEARHEAWSHPDRVSLEQALREFIDWFGDAKIVWTNSPSFDCVIIKNAMRLCNLAPPWEYWNERDCRTLFDIAGVRHSELPRAAHNAVSDCCRQITGVMWSVNRLNEKAHSEEL